MYSESDGPVVSPLNLNDVKLIDKASLSSLDKHFVRLLAHCLACFKLMGNGSDNREIPSEKNCLGWLTTQTGYKDDTDFLMSLLEQFVAAGKELELVAEHYQIAPLELTLEQLISFVEKTR